MIIGINEYHEITFRASGAIENTIPVNEETTFRVDGIPEVDANEKLLFNPETKEFYTAEREQITHEAWEKMNRKSLAEQKKAEALKWLADNDWKINKHTLGEWADDDPRWLEYLADRKRVREEYETAEETLAGIA